MFSDRSKKKSANDVDRIVSVGLAAEATITMLVEMSVHLKQIKNCNDVGTVCCGKSPAHGSWSAGEAACSVDQDMCSVHI